MIGHDHEWTESVMAKLDAALHGIADGLGDFILAQKTEAHIEPSPVVGRATQMLGPRRPCAVAGSGRGAVCAPIAARTSVARSGDAER